MKGNQSQTSPTCNYFQVCFPLRPWGMGRAWFVVFYLFEVAVFPGLPPSDLGDRGEGICMVYLWEVPGSGFLGK